MLVPVQYRRIMERRRLRRVRSLEHRLKTSTSAPFPADLKADVLERWPGGLVEFYGMTEGGGSTMLVAHLVPEQAAHRRPAEEGHDIRLIDETGRELPKGKFGEVVGRSAKMMLGYHNLPDKTCDAEWVTAKGGASSAPATSAGSTRTAS